MRYLWRIGCYSHRMNIGTFEIYAECHDRYCLYNKYFLTKTFISQFTI